MPEVVSRHGTRLLSNHARSLRPDELWLVHEQVCEALLDTGDVSRAKDVVLKLDKRFPKSLRVAVLKGQLFECCEDYESAEEIYAHILEVRQATQRDYSELPSPPRFPLIFSRETLFIQKKVERRH